MRKCPSIQQALCLSVVTLFVWNSSSAWAQRTPASSPASGPAASGQPQAGDVPSPPRGQAAANPIVEAIRAEDPRSAEALLRAVRIMLDASEWAEATSYLDKLLASNIDDATAHQLFQQYGSPLFTRLKLTPHIQPQGRQFAEHVQQAVRRLREDPTWVHQQLEWFQDERRRVQAIRNLMQARRTVVPLALAELADPGQQEKHAVWVDVLRVLGTSAVPGLTAALQADDAQFVGRVASLLLDLPFGEAADSVLVALYRSDLAPQVSQRLREKLGERLSFVPARRVVLRRWEKQFFHVFPASTGDDLLGDEMETWLWNPAKRKVEVMALTAPDRRRWSAFVCAQNLYRLAPEKEEYRRYLVAAEAEWYQTRTDIEEEVAWESPHAALWDDPRLVNEVLQLSLENRRVGAATWAARRLGKIGNASLLTTVQGRTAPLVEALRFPHAGVQWAAAEAILHINPVYPFAGSARWRDVLGYFLGARPGRRALVGNPHVEEAQSWAGYLQQLGMEVDVVSTGRAVLDQLARVPDYEFVLLVDRLDAPSAQETIQLARVTPWAGQMRFAVLASSLALPELRVALEEDRSVFVGPRVASEQSMRWVVGRLEELPGARPALPEHRALRVATILTWLEVRVAGEDTNQWQWVRLEDRIAELADSPSFGSRACSVLGAFGTAKAQKRLVDVASQIALPIELRRAAAAAFARAVARRGIMLTSADILLQYDRYNASAALDAQTQQVLAHILDVLENRPAKADLP